MRAKRSVSRWVSAACLAICGIAGAEAQSSLDRTIQTARDKAAADAEKAKTGVPPAYVAPPSVTDETKRNIAKQKAGEKFDKHLFGEDLRAGGREVPR